MAAQLPGVVCQVLNAFDIDTGTLCLASSPAPGSTAGAVDGKVTKEKIVAACEARWDANKSDCSGFVKAVAADLGITITGLANDIVGQMKSAPWVPLKSGAEASEKAERGHLVLGGLKATGHGHVVIVVGGLGEKKYPTAYWGQLGGVGRKAATINWAWNPSDRDKVIYAYYGGAG